jgi:branched-chain amino acid transport system substrate-binding protein
MKRKNIIGWVIGIAVVGILIIVSLAKQNKQPETIKIGAILPLTGDISEYGQRVKRGIELAVEEINSMSPRKLQIIYEDSKGSSKEGVSAAYKLINSDKVKFIIGAVSSSVTLSIVPFIHKHKVLLFSPASSSPKLSGISEFFIRNWPSDVLEAKVLASYAYDKLNIKKVCIFYVNNDYGIGLMEEFTKTFKNKGGKILGVESYPLNNTNFKNIIVKYKNIFKEIDAIYLAGYHKDMAFATKHLREEGYKGMLLANADYGIPEVFKIAGDAAEGTIYATPWYNPQSNEKSKKFFENFKLRYNTLPSEFEANGYDAVRIIFEGIQMYGYEPLKVAQYIKTLKHYEGAGGYLTFTSLGDVIKPIAIMKVTHGEFKMYEVFEIKE